MASGISVVCDEVLPRQLLRDAEAHIGIAPDVAFMLWCREDDREHCEPVCQLVDMNELPDRDSLRRGLIERERRQIGNHPRRVVGVPKTTRAQDRPQLVRPRRRRHPPAKRRADRLQPLDHGVNGGVVEIRPRHAAEERNLHVREHGEDLVVVDGLGVRKAGKTAVAVVGDGFDGLYVLGAHGGSIAI